MAISVTSTQKRKRSVPSKARSKAAATSKTSSRKPKPKTKARTPKRVAKKQAQGVVKSTALNPGPIRPYGTQGKAQEAQPSTWGVWDRDATARSFNDGATRAFLVVKDPWWLYAYWQIDPETDRATRNRLKAQEIEGVQACLRVYDVSGLEPAAYPGSNYADIALSSMARSWYIHSNNPGHDYVVELGLLTKLGNFYPFVRSDCARTPHVGPVDQVDPNWQVSSEQFWSLLETTLGPADASLSASQMMSANQAQPTEQQVHEVIRRLIEGKVGSESFALEAVWSSFGLFSSWSQTTHLQDQVPSRNFWLYVDAELIVYGATDPKARVTAQGKPIVLRPDGSFSLRMQLPDGVQHIPVEAVSPDGKEKRCVIPVVTRTTSAHQSFISREPKEAAPGERS